MCLGSSQSPPHPLILLLKGDPIDGERMEGPREGIRSPSSQDLLLLLPLQGEGRAYIGFLS